MSRHTDRQAVAAVGERSECLENRLMLTQFIVDTNLDVVNGSDGLTSLREAITAANSNAGADTIDFTGTFGAFEPIVLSLGELTITEGLTINGSTAFSLSVEVDGDDLSRVFNIDTTDAVTFIGVDVTGGAAVDGAGIFNNGSDLTYQFGMISNNNATGSGGGIFNAAGTVSIEQSNINDNTAVRAGGGIEDQSNDANAITFTNGNLNGNSATGGVAGPGNGGGLHVTGSGNVTITNVSVTGNTAASEGGGLWNGTGTMTISDTSGNVLIDGNTASGNDANNGGGGIFNAGGTVLIQDNDPTNTITISNNIADGTSGSGGGILNDAGGTLTVTGATISGNAANRAGGGIESTAGTTNTLTSVTLIDNVAGRAGSASPGNGGGLHITGNGNADIMGGSVTGNFAASEGGGLWNGTGTMTIDGTMITGNAAAGNGADQGGGGVFNAGGTLDIDNATISNNLAAAAITFSLDGNQVVPPVSTSASGSAIAQLDPATGTFRLDLFVTGMELPTNPGGLPDLTMANVHLGAAGVNGPVIFDLLALGSFVQEDNGLRLILDGEVFPEDSLADLLAGNTYVNIQSDDNMSGEIRGQIIVPSTMGSGGGILNDQGTLTVDNSTIDGNIASRAGGGIETNVGTTTLTNVTLSNNVAGPDGAATPGNGGGLHVTGAGGVTINGGMVTGNTAAAEGGGLWNSSTGTMTIQAGGMGGTLIDSNTANGDGAVQGGGGIFNVGGTLSITDATISNNVSTATQAGNGGGGILIEGGANNSITDTTISGNTANTSGTADGGGILLTGGSTLTISGGTISGNSANRAGGGIENNASTVTLTDVTLGGVMVADGNNAGVNGGGLHVSGAGTTNVNGGTVQNNVAGQEGGGLWNATGTMTIDGTTISGNSANAGNNGGNDQGGGGVFNIGGTLDIDNATITGNFATVNAGNGGGVMTVGGTVTIDDSTISGNSVARAGGGIENNNGMLTLTGVIVGGTMVSDGNSAGVNGGGLHVTGSGTTNVNGGAFELNTAAQEGGGLWNGTGTMTIDGVAILQNVASGNGADQGGGGVFNAGGEVIIQNGTTISRNVANGTSGSGGGILNDAGGTLTVSDSTIELNTANRAGGGIEDNSGQFSVVELTNVTLDGNSAGVDIGVVVMAAPGNGGGLHVTGAGVVNIFDGTVNNNVAAAEGGGLWNNTGQMDVVGTTISGNTAFGTGVDEGGGGIFNKGGDLDVQSATLSGNTATSGFGAAIFNEGGTVAIGMTTLDGDVAGGDLTDDTFDIFETSVTIISQGGSDTTIVSGDATDDSFVVTPDTAGLGATVTVQNGSAFTINTDSETLNLLGDIGDDDFTVDFGNAVTLGTVTNLSIGGAGETSADSLTLTGTGSFVDVTQTTTTAVDGSFSLNTDKIVVDYSSIESIINNLLEGLSLAQTPDQVIGAGAGSVDILIASSTDDSEIPVLTVGALPDYASFVDNGNGTGVLTLNPATGDASTNADITVTATIAGLSASDTFNVAVVSPAQAFPNNTIFAVNSAGGAVGNFSSDSNFNTGSTFSTGAAIDVSDSSIPSGTPAGIFKTTRFDFNGGSELQYAFPTGVGNFEVTLFFAEIYSPVFRAGGRVFDVSIEGVLELDDFDVFAQAGAGNKGIARTFQVVSDGTLNIDFGHVVENPMVMGIQIVDLNPVANAGPQVASVAPVVNLLSGNSTTIDVSATDLEGDSIALSVTGLPEFASFVDNGNGTGTITVSSAATDEGLFGVTVQATSGTPALTDSASFTLSVAPFVPQPLPQEVININAGGPALPGDPGFVRDDNFQNGVGLDFGTGATIDTSDASIPSGTPAQLFNTVTFDRAGGAELQLDIPTQHTGIAYEVTLYFVEIYGPTARTGARVFDVSIDGQLVLDNFDVFAAAGAINRGIARTFQITSDGNVDIDFGHVTENPALAGVSVRQIDQVFSSAP
tara:strand:- start:309223 stop:315027 length:5805 start_codon:yes stop_codon:yes gene_type:complete